MRFFAAALPLLAILTLHAPAVSAQAGVSERLPLDQLDIRSPADRVVGEPGEMRFQDQSCRDFPDAELRSRIVNAAVQEWAYFGSAVLDYASEESFTSRITDRRRWSLLNGSSAARLADSIAGYWATTPQSGWILERQNGRWKSNGRETRWRDPWSAAFISWVMCESGLETEAQFSRAVAHHTYIDQAIRARDGLADDAAFRAFDVGEQPVVPGDLLCRGSRPAYQSIAERRRHLGVGARSHCDIVVKVDTEQAVFSVIGGNVRGTVGMKLLPGELNDDGFLQPTPYGDSNRRIFAHLQLQAAPLPLNALDLSPTIQAGQCRNCFGLDRLPSGSSGSAK